MYRDDDRQIIISGEKGYLNLLEKILHNGTSSDDRTGVGTLKIFGHMLRFDLYEGFPLFTTKKVWFKGILHELLWFISGSTNIRPLVLNGVHIWDEWPFQEYLWIHRLEDKFPKYSKDWESKKDWFIQSIIEDENFANLYGDLGSQAYGKGWRNFDGVDQLQLAIDTLRNSPNSRRIIVSAWNPKEIAKMPQASLPPCHYSFQFVADKDMLSVLVNIRSWDVFLGGPFNVASYSLLLMMIAQIVDMKPHEVIISSGDTHIYKTHRGAVQTQLWRAVLDPPIVEINADIKDIGDFKSEDFTLKNYHHHEAISAPIAV